MNDDTIVWSVEHIALADQDGWMIAHAGTPLAEIRRTTHNHQHATEVALWDSVVAAAELGCMLALRALMHVSVLNPTGYKQMMRAAGELLGPEHQTTMLVVRRPAAEDVA